MNKNHVIISALLMICFILVIGCQNIPDNINPEIEMVNDISIAEAKEWFISETKSNLRTDGKNEIYRKALWEEAFEHTFYKTQKVIVVPLIHTVENEFSGFKQLWVYKNKDGKNTLRVVEYIYDIKKGEKGKKKTLKNFSGTLIFRNWDNEFLYGLGVKNNKFIDAFDALYKGDPKLVTPRSNKKAKVGGWTCGWSDNYSLVTIEVVGHPEWSYYYWSYSSGYDCYWTDNNEWAPPTDNGNSNFDAPSNNENGSLGNSNDSNFNYTIANSECEGFNKMWQLQNQYTKEALGFITSDGKILITPMASHTENHASVQNQYYGSNGGVIMYFGIIDGVYKVELYNDTGIVGTYTITGMVHTHPNNTPGTTNEFPSSFDTSLASTYNSLNAFILGENYKIQYNQYGTISQTPRSCY